MKINYPKISIITPTFNQGEFIEETILSVLNQDYPNLEYIIIDGGSNDNTVNIIKKYEEKITYWISEPDNGQSDAINKGLKIATGEIVNWLNSDDFYASNTLLTVGEQFTNKNISCLVGKSRFFSKENETIGYGSSYINFNSFEETICKPIIDQPSTFFLRETVDEMGPLTENLHYCMDKEWWIKYLLLHELHSIETIDQVFVNFRYHNDSKTVSGSRFFMKDHANILYSISKNVGLNNYAELLFLKYDLINNYEFKFEPKLLDVKLINRMLIHFSLKQSRLIYSESDFLFAKKVKKNVESFSCDLFEDEIKYLSELKNKVGVGSWLVFKLKRKINHLLK